MAAKSKSSSTGKKNRAFYLLVLAALGVVYGDIGTSPLYALKESFHHFEPTQDNVLGILSLLWMSVTFIVTFKYVTKMLHADHHGEGGIPAQLWLLRKKIPKLFIIFAIFGVGLLYGDGIITPAISVLSAVEGLQVVYPWISPTVVVRSTIGILTLLFMVQRTGTDWLGKGFGPVMMVWFACIGTLGLVAIAQNPVVLLALNPWYGIKFFLNHHWEGTVVFTTIVLAVTGGEALYADLGHFNDEENGIKARNVIRAGWLYVAKPALLLNYFGQGAAVLKNPEFAKNPFYGIVPEAVQLPMVGLATIATIIASQALITGAFSLTKQLIDMHNIPHIEIISTSSAHPGQIYIPVINRILFIGCIALVMVFDSSSKLAAAYGIAVTGTMSITTLLYFLVRVIKWKKPVLSSLALCGLFLGVDLVFFTSNLTKVQDGGWVPLMVGLGLTIMMQWFYMHGRSLRKKQRVKLHPVNIDHSKDQVVVLVNDIVHFGTAYSISAAKFLGVPSNIVHVLTNDERCSTIQHMLEQIGEDSLVTVKSPSGAVVRPAVAKIRKIAANTDGYVWVFMSCTITGNRTTNLHSSTWMRLTQELHTIPKVITVQVPWHVNGAAK